MDQLTGGDFALDRVEEADKSTRANFVDAGGLA
jgi:hypothetical protein